MSLPTDQRWMSRALALAERGQGSVHPNPLVGAVLARGHRLIAEAWHERYGGPHAEPLVLAKAGKRARGATLYVTLEPCAHWGKTPPCADAVIAAGVRRVVAAMRDPNPLVAGRGFARLRRAGIFVSTGILETQARALNQPFITWVTEKRPWVTLKAATSLDGKIATRKGESKWITGLAARRSGHAWRARCDAIAVGIETVLRDDPTLTSHGSGKDPRRVIFDSRLRLPLQSAVARQGFRTTVLTASAVSSERRMQLEKQGVAVWTIPKDKRGHVDIVSALRHLAHEGVAHLLLEGGGTLHAAFLEAGMVDEVIWFIAPMIIGGSQAKTAVEGQGVQRLTDAWRLRDVRWEKVGDDFYVRGLIDHRSGRG